jgi:riboflavin transporter
MRVFRVFPRFTPLTIAYAALLIALSVVLSAWLSFPLDLFGVYIKKIGFGSVPVMLGGMLFGPVVGGIIGALSDVLQYIIAPKGAYIPLFTLTNLLIGVIPSLFFLWDRSDRRKGGWAFLKVLLAVAVTYAVCSVFLNTLWLLLLSFPQYVPGILSGSPSPEAQTFMIVRAVSAAISVPVFAAILHTLYRYRRVYISPRMEQHVKASPQKQ